MPSSHSDPADVTPKPPNSDLTLSPGAPTTGEGEGEGGRVTRERLEAREATKGTSERCGLESRDTPPVFVDSSHSLPTHKTGRWGEDPKRRHTTHLFAAGGAVGAGADDSDGGCGGGGGGGGGGHRLGGSKPVAASIASASAPRTSLSVPSAVSLRTRVGAAARRDPSPSVCLPPSTLPPPPRDAADGEAPRAVGPRPPPPLPPDDANDADDAARVAIVVAEAPPPAAPPPAKPLGVAAGVMLGVRRGASAVAERAPVAAVTVAGVAA